MSKNQLVFSSFFLVLVIDSRLYNKSRPSVCRFVGMLSCHSICQSHLMLKIGKVLKTGISAPPVRDNFVTPRCLFHLMFLCTLVLIPVPLLSSFSPKKLQIPLYSYATLTVLACMNEAACDFLPFGLSAFQYILSMFFSDVFFLILAFMQGGIQSHDN